MLQHQLSTPCEELKAATHFGLTNASVAFLSLKGEILSVTVTKFFGNLILNTNRGRSRNSGLGKFWVVFLRTELQIMWDLKGTGSQLEESQEPSIVHDREVVS